MAPSDPVATENMDNPNITYADSSAKALESSGTAMVGTDRDGFATPGKAFNAMVDLVVIDGR